MNIYQAFIYWNLSLGGAVVQLCKSVKSVQLRVDLRQVHITSVQLKSMAVNLVQSKQKTCELGHFIVFPQPLFKARGLEQIAKTCELGHFHRFPTALI